MEKEKENSCCSLNSQYSVSHLFVFLSLVIRLLPVIEGWGTFPQMSWRFVLISAVVHQKVSEAVVGTVAPQFKPNVYVSSIFHMPF